MSYALLENGRAIRCNQCGRTSWNSSDVKNRYCGNCHKFHAELEREAREAHYRANSDSTNHVLYTQQMSRVYADTPAPADECRAPDPTPDPTPTIDFGNTDCSPSSSDSGGWSDV